MVGGRRLMRRPLTGNCGGSSMAGFFRETKRVEGPLDQLEARFARLNLDHAAADGEVEFRAVVVERGGFDRLTQALGGAEGLVWPDIALQEHERLGREADQALKTAVFD